MGTKTIFTEFLFKIVMLNFLVDLYQYLLKMKCLSYKGDWNFNDAFLCKISIHTSNTALKAIQFHGSVLTVCNVENIEYSFKILIHCVPLPQQDELDLNELFQISIALTRTKNNLLWSFIKRWQSKVL